MINNHLLRSFFLAIFITIFLSNQSVLAQGGPPMLTDDSGTPGTTKGENNGPARGKWENNFAFEFEGSKNDYIKNFPILDLNYGLGDRIQLKAEFTWVAEKGENLANKFDNLTLGFKYRIIDGSEEELSLSVYPQPIISFNPEQGGKSVEMIELAHEVHPFFIAGQFHPELKSRATKAHPLFREFVKASLAYHEAKGKKKK